MNTEDNVTDIQEDNIVLYDTKQVLQKPKPVEIETFDLVDLDHPALHKVLPELIFKTHQSIQTVLLPHW